MKKTPFCIHAPDTGRAQIRRLAPALAAALALAGALAPAADAIAPEAGRPVVRIARVHDAIGPVSARFMADAIERAEAEKAECVLFELDTPGGLDDSMRLVIKRMLGAQVPVVVYVAPAGARAASAGAFITLAAHVAAMAPNTVIGAAHPVSVGGEAMETNMSAKVANDAAALIRSLAEKRGRNVDWADSAVRQSVSLSETEALAKKVIDLVAPSLDALVKDLDGRVVQINDAPRTIRTVNAVCLETQMTWRDRFLAFISNPNVAYLLFMLGLLGIYFELSNPGAILPGTVGVIAIILALFAFQTMPINIAGIALMVLAVILFILEAKIVSNGVLFLGGLVSMVIGSLMLIDAPDPALRVSLQVIIGAVAVTGAFFAVGVWLSAVALLRRPVSGAPGLVGLEGDARTAINAEGGCAFVAGAHWNARADREIPAGTRVRVLEVTGMTLKVGPLAGGA